MILRENIAKEESFTAVRQKSYSHNDSICVRCFITLGNTAICIEHVTTHWQTWLRMVALDNSRWRM